MEKASGSPADLPLDLDIAYVLFRWISETMQSGIANFKNGELSLGLWNTSLKKRYSITSYQIFKSRDQDDLINEKITNMLVSKKGPI